MLSSSFAQTDLPMEPSAQISSVICIPTFRRPELLRQTLRSLVALSETPRYGCVVVDNDVIERAGARVVAKMTFGSMPVMCAVEPSQGNCQAINTCFRLALSRFPRAEYILMIDDDEWASERWLFWMITAAELSGADIVGGPVFPVFSDPSKQHLAHHPVFRPAYDCTGEVPTIYGTGNCLIRRSVFEKMGDSPLDEAFTFLGGGDTDFFLRCARAGLRFFWEERAEIFEHVSPERTTTRWVLARSLRIGAINYCVDRKKGGLYRYRTFVTMKSVAVLAKSIIEFVPALIRSRSVIIASHGAFVALGRLLAEVGLVPQQYKSRKVPTGQ